MFPFAHIFTVHLECHRPVRAEGERGLVVQAARHASRRPAVAA